LVFEDGKELLHFTSGAGALGGDQVAKDLSHRLLTLSANPFQRRLSVLRQGSGDSTDLLVSFSIQQLPRPVSFFSIMTPSFP